MGKFRNVAVIVYAEDISFEELKRRVGALHVPAFISPLHDVADQNVSENFEDDQERKAHYHVMVMYDNPRSEDTIRSDLLSFSNGRYKQVISARGYARYLCHLDEKDKKRYEPEEVTELGGAVYKDYLTTDIDKADDVCAIIDYIEENDINTFRDMVIMLRKEHKVWLLSVYDRGAYFFKEYLKDRREWRFSSKGNV